MPSRSQGTLSKKYLYFLGWKVYGVYGWANEIGWYFGYYWNLVRVFAYHIPSIEEIGIEGLYASGSFMASSQKLCFASDIHIISAENLAITRSFLYEFLFYLVLSKSIYK